MLMSYIVLHDLKGVDTILMLTTGRLASRNSELKALEHSLEEIKFEKYVLILNQKWYS